MLNGNSALGGVRLLNQDRAVSAAVEGDLAAADSSIGIIIVIVEGCAFCKGIAHINGNIGIGRCADDSDDLVINTVAGILSCKCNAACSGKVGMGTCAYCNVQCTEAADCTPVV